MFHFIYLHVYLHKPRQNKYSASENVVSHHEPLFISLMQILEIEINSFERKILRLKYFELSQNPVRDT